MQILNKQIGLLGTVVLLAGAMALAMDRPALAARPTFTNVTQAAGINYVQGPALTERSLATVIVHTGGAAAGDFDGDGWTDLFVTRSDNTDILYRNLGNGQFADVTSSSFGTSPIRTSTNAPAWGDIDNDGDLDLYVSVVGQNQHLLYINQGDGTFTEQAVLRGAGVGNGTDPIYGSGISLGDYDRDGYLDMFVAEWRPGSIFREPFYARLLHNRGAAAPGEFTDQTFAAGVTKEVAPGVFIGNSMSFSPRFADLDGDRHPDLVITGDNKSSQLFWNNGDGTFSDGTEAAGIATGLNDMGSAIGDIDGDGRLDWFITDIFRHDGSVPANENGNRLWHNDGNRQFSDQTTAAGVRNAHWGWGTAMFDYDNDGDLDIGATNGFVSFPGFFNDPTKLFENDGTGVFTEVGGTVGFDHVGQGRGLLTFDYDNDGDLDVFLANNGEQPVLYRNDGGNDNGFLRIDLEGTLSNRDGIGALIRVTPDLDEPASFIVREVDAGTHYLSQSEFTAHFGLGNDVTTIDEVVIEWPSGITQRLTDLDINMKITVTETAVPEPSALLLAGFAAVGFWFFTTKPKHLANGFSRVCLMGFLASFFGLSLGLAPDARAQGIVFTDITASAGIGLTEKLTESVTWGDYDNDGDPDLYLTSKGANNLFRNDGAGVFTDVTATAGVGNALFSVGTAFGDLDNDGDLDLYVVNFGSGPDAFYRNDGPSGPGGAYQFTDISVAAGTTFERSSRGMAFVDYDHDGLLDIYVNAIGNDLLYHNKGNLQFEEVAAAVGIAGVGGQGVGVVATDVNRDGKIDLFTGNRSSDPNRLFLNNGDGTFVDSTVASGIAEIGLGMGVLAIDYDNDLDTDLYWTTWPGTGPTPKSNAFYRNNGDATPTFTETAVDTGTLDALGWGISVNAGDIDNDGWVDFFITNGFNSSSTANVLFRNNTNVDGTFQDVTSTLEGGAAFDGRGVSFADFDLDGDLDLLVTADSGESTRLWRNDTVNNHHWITLKLAGVESNASAIGARIEITTSLGTFMQEVSGGAGRGSQNDLPVEFGLGTASSIDEIKIFWPSGNVQTVSNLAVDQFLTITEQVPEPSSWILLLLGFGTMRTRRKLRMGFQFEHVTKASAMRHAW